MKKTQHQRAPLQLILSILLGTMASWAYAADTSHKFFRTTEVQVMDMPALTGVMQDWSAYVKREFPGHHSYSFQTDDTGRAYFIDMAGSLADFERHDQENSQAREQRRSRSLPDLSSAWWRSFPAANTSVWERLPELCYGPANDVAWELPFRMVRIFHLKRGREEEVFTALKALNQLDESLGITAPRLVLSLRIGADTPAVALITPAQDLLSYYSGYTQRSEQRTKHPRGQEILSTLGNCSRRVDNRHMTIHPELSKRPL
jgi:hypothetical protein